MSRTSRYGWLFVSPAVTLLLFSVVVPFLAAVLVTATDQRLISPNRTNYIGAANYTQLLSLSIVKQSPLNESAPAASRYARVREVMKAIPGLRGYRPMVSFEFGSNRYTVVAGDPVFWRSLFNTLLFALLVIPLQCGSALMLALVLNQEFKGRTFFRTAYFAPVVTSMVVVSIVWSFIYNPHAGLLNAALSAVSGGDVHPDWLGDPSLALFSVVLMSAWQGAGFQMLIFLGGLQSISKELEEAAIMDGANRLQRFRYVTLPGLRNTLSFVIISTTIAAFSLFVQVDVLTRGGPADSTSTLVYHAVRLGFREQDVAYGSTIAVVYFLLVLGLSQMQRRYNASKERA